VNRFKPADRTYVRSTNGWWWKNSYFIRYMIREGSAVFLSAYVLVLLVGLYRLSQGQHAFDDWRVALASPGWILFHIVALLLVGYHSYTWFQVMPKTAPRLPIDPKLISAGGIASAAGLSVLILAVLWWLTG
jgi:fumarate reductase subunit C